MIFSGRDVDGDEMFGSVTTVVVVDCARATSGIGVIASASDSAGATAGGSLWSHASNWSTIAPILFSRAHDAMFC